MLYPQNGDRIVTIDSVTSLHPVYNASLKLDFAVNARATEYVDSSHCGTPGSVVNVDWNSYETNSVVRRVLDTFCDSTTGA